MQASRIRQQQFDGGRKRGVGRPKGSVSKTYRGSPTRKFEDKFGPTRLAIKDGRENPTSSQIGILFDWRPAVEAKAVFHLYETKQVTLDGARDLIVMSAKCRKLLISKDYCIPSVVEKLFDFRMETWKIFSKHLERKNR